jgi:hypothetical protein
VWADGVYLQARMEPAAECMLVLIGATPEGKKELVGFQTGVRETALASLGIITDHWKRVGRRHVPTGCDVWGRSMRWDREDELDLADVGGEANANTHGSSLASPSRRPKRTGHDGATVRSSRRTNEEL